ncbi:MAG: hypothetical protein V7K21_27215 [Nostoc sp.]|uniref:hypothetical protein n=1 Tax=Nostoc sp. TaxID=1180 RepID=UPI002FF67D64
MVDVNANILIVERQLIKIISEANSSLGQIPQNHLYMVEAMEKLEDMQLIETKESQKYIDLAKSLAKEFAKTAVERDAKGGIPKHERDRYCQSRGH